MGLPLTSSALEVARSSPWPTIVLVTTRVHPSPAPSTPPVQLRYARDAAEAVSAAIDLERACCAFLDFTVEVGSADVRVTVRGPQAVLDAMIGTLTDT